MPRISAPTVAEHRQEMESALLAAARSLLTERGPEAVTLAAVGARVGLARNSVYEYFRSREDLIGAVIEHTFREWSGAVLASLEPGLAPREAVTQYIRVTLEKLGKGDHRAMSALGTEGLPEHRRARIAGMHRQLTEPLSAALAATGIDNPGRSARLLQGLVDAAFREIEAGQPAGEVTAETARMAEAVLDGLTGSGRN